MQALGRRYVRYVNDRYCRTGTLWEGRYKAGMVDSESYVLSCYRHIELNPVRARMVASPDAYPWSSSTCNGLGSFNSLLQPHASYLSLGSSSAERTDTYHAFVMQAISFEELDDIRLHLQRQHAYGSESFRAAIEAQLGRRASPAKNGRPRKAKPS